MLYLASHAFALLLLVGTHADDEAVGLRHEWAASLGASYSRVAAGSGAVVTQGSDGDQDYVVALEPADGSVRWRHELGPIYLGHDGSEDGPISTPAIGVDSVFALDPRGKLVALDLASGALRWSTDLVEELGAVLPEYGFTSSPVLEGDVLIVQAGGSAGHNLCGFDAGTGKLRWSLGEGEAAYQSPVVLGLLGRRQVIVLNGREILGVAPADGSLLWSHTLADGEEASTGSAGPIDNERFFCFVNGRLAVFLLAQADQGYVAEELFRTRELGGGYAKPVYHEGFLYGFRSSFLSCVDAQNGKRVWKSRPPGGRGLVLVDDRLVVFASEGVVAVVRATPEGYVEDARVQALEHSGYAWPTFAGGRVYVRNSSQVASLELVARGAPASASTSTTPADATSDNAFATLLAQLSASADPQAGVEAFLAEQESFPILAGDEVHFVYRGDAQDVAVEGSMTGGAKADPMTRLAGTDLFVKSYPIEPGAHWTYTFQVDFEPGTLDPLNPRTSPGRRGPVSDLVTPGYTSAQHLAQPASARGRLESFTFASEQLGNQRELQVYLPPGYDAGEARHALLLVHDGPEWIEKGLMLHSLDNLIGESVQPLVVVFVPPLDDWWYEAGGSKTVEYVDMLATELVPLLESKYRLLDSPAQRALFGVRGFGLTATFGVVSHPQVFAKAAVQSASLEDVTRHALFEALQENPPTGALFYVDWNRYEDFDRDRGYDFALYAATLTEALRAAGCRVVGGEALDAHGWGSWRSRTDDVLEALFPLE